MCAVAIAVYGNAFRTGFAFDSRQLILQDTRVQAATAENVRQILQHTYWWPYGESGLYRPLTTITYLVNDAVLGNGDHAAGYHAFNVLLHLVNVLLVWMLVRRVSGADDVSFAAAAIWAVLPVSVEAVTNIVGRADLLAACGVLAGVLLYGRSWLGLAAATALAVFSKESGVVILPIVVCYEWTRWNRKTSRRALAIGGAAMAVPLVAMWAARSAVLAASPAAETAFVDNPIVGASWIAGRLTALKVAGIAIGKIAWPATLSADYSFDAIAIARGSLRDWLAWLTVALVVAAIVAAARWSRAAAFFGAFAVLAYLPASNLLFATGTIFGERLLYLPSVGLVALAAMALARLPRPAFLAVASALVVAFGVRTWTRNPDWTSDVTLWRAAVSAEPSSAKTHHALAEALYDADPTHANLDAVIAEQERAVTIVDRLPDDLNALLIFRQAGAYHLDRATALAADGGPEFERARTRLERAKAIYDAGAKRYGEPNAATEADIDRLLAAAYLGVHDAEHAIAAATRARDLQPLAPLPYRQIATAQLAREEADAAAVTLMVGSMVTADPGLTQALLGLYAAGVDEGRCAAASGPSGPTLNTNCEVVQRHLCAAAPEAARLDRQLGRFTEAERVESTARTLGRCGGT
ncbi:MAG TPA: hypothetical protein VFA27_01165 [Vicinamibacterales bacterium]|nr:hypothetical protein [Vicinamibacterales bacterium]